MVVDDGQFLTHQNDPPQKFFQPYSLLITLCVWVRLVCVAPPPGGVDTHILSHESES